MSQDLERSLGRVEGKLSSIEDDVREIKGHVQGLQRFQFKQAGAYLILSAIVSGFVAVGAAAIASVIR